ncbi:MAG: hypothetical protein U0Z70_07015 [Thermomicrobiales bacterium]
MTTRRCRGTTRKGTPCTATARHGSLFCLFHDPSEEAEARRRENSQKGGKARSNAERARRQMVDAALSNDELDGYIGLMIQQVTENEIAPAVANSVATLVRAAVALRQATTLEERLAAIEQQLNLRGVA